MKRSFILFELLIALALISILLTILFRFFASSLRMDQTIEKAKQELFQRENLQIRLSSILSSIVPRSALPSSCGPSFYTSDDDGFIVIFDHGIDPEPAFSGPILAKIFIDADSNLTMVTWPLEKLEKNVYRKEILLPHVQKMRFQFLSKINQDQIDPKASIINPALEWRSNWPQNRWDIPSMIRILIEHNNKEIGFAFTLPFLEPIATYHHLGGKG